MPDCRSQARAIFLFAVLSLLPFSASANPVSLQSEDARWISNMIFQNECQREVLCLISWNEGEDFLSMGIGHFIWYPKGRVDRYRESFPDLIQYLEANHQKIPESVKKMMRDGPPWKTRREFRYARFGKEAAELREFLKETMGLQAMYMLHRFQKSVLQMLEDADPIQRTILVEKILSLSQSRQGIYAMIDYLNFKGDGLSQKERYQGQGWGLMQVFTEMNWPAGAEGSDFEFVEAARRVLQRRVINSPAERQESRWILGWENRVKTYSVAASFSPPDKMDAIVLPEKQDVFEILNLPDFSAHA